ncbi:hypothetical protein EDB85DRAFT_2147135 [Lactarius pseudohatsudake]|nr:hypothetical protein EDB85DRAFT_2147135 [Lactarius pseudohatsudake]
MLTLSPNHYHRVEAPLLFTASVPPSECHHVTHLLFWIRSSLFLLSPCRTAHAIVDPAEERGKMRSQCESHRHAKSSTSSEVPVPFFKSVFPTFGSRPKSPPVWEWHPLVCVRRRWREIIFASPLRLDLQLLCTHRTPVRKNLGCWPPTIPIVIGHGYYSWKSLTPEAEDNVFAAFEQRDRVRRINLSVKDAVLEKMVTLMQEPFPKLRDLAISSRSQDMPVLPDGFLGGSAPSLREISLNGVHFPELPTFLSSASDLVSLILFDIPQVGYISPAAFVACLAVLPRLERLSIAFRFLDSPTDRTQPPPAIRAVLPSLTTFVFESESAYSEVIMSRLDTPQLDSMIITYTDFVAFRITELSKFIERSALKPSRLGHAKICFDDDDIWLYLFRKTDPDEPPIAIRITSSVGLVFKMARVLNQTSAMLSDVVRLEVTIESYMRDYVGEDIDDDTEWLGLFRPFSAVKKLLTCEELAECITRALEGQTEEADTRVLPSLKSICVEDQHAKEARELRERGRFPSNGDEGLDSDDSE